MDKILEISQQYGAAGLIFLSLGWFILYLTRLHREERKEVTEGLKLQHDECMSARKEAVSALQNNTSILTEISTIIRRLNI